MNDLFQTFPDSDGNSIIKKGYQLWLLAEQVAKLLNFEDNVIPYSKSELEIFSSIIILREFRKVASQIDDSEEIIQHFLKFPSYRISEIRKSFLFRVDPDRLSSTYKTDPREDSIRSAIGNIDVFIQTRESFYSGYLEDFYGPRRVPPFKAIYLPFYEPLAHLAYLNADSDYSQKVSSELMKIMNLKLEYVRDNIFEFLIPILTL